MIMLVPTLQSVCIHAMRCHAGQFQHQNGSLHSTTNGEHGKEGRLFQQRSKEEV